MKAATLIRDIPDFPQPGIMFKDITPVLADPVAFAEVIAALSEDIKRLRPDVIVGIESRGFLFGAPVAHELGVGFVPFRKAGKLPYKTVTQEYALEYGTATVEAHVDAIKPGQRVVIVDDVLATGGTAVAAGQLVEKLGGATVGFAFFIELAFLAGRSKLVGRDITTLLSY
ncbi:adenine phosphoribosyltransferase [Armatimonas rosea]|uniref:Adenine phosphoribosyltransferase n=1 Tax=Armatimonas rosea TaxID=685828 RepID=A0A7W9STU3_ARMRO|nr:adenine phosphoribosyltransferase [Armatimonas rosea]MBB6052721.1 adenine phosphoribosyltransferase [Armatimonas rosea]